MLFQISTTQVWLQNTVKIKKKLKVCLIFYVGENGRKDFYKNWYFLVNFDNFNKLLVQPNYLPK